MIEKKRDGGTLGEAEWRFVVERSLRQDADTVQIAALLMACVFRPLNVSETVALTRAMIASGETLAFHRFSGAVDKHSTGGVGDTASLVIVPLLAACGERVAKLSGRALGHTGGTLDKLQSVPGLRVELSASEFESVIAEVGCAIAAQSASLVPADKVLYALRDHTGTVPSAGLIAASIVSKKIAGGAQRIAFDVKVGSGAFIKTPEDARKLARLLVDVAAEFGRESVAVITDMHQPLGPFIGNGLEMIAARDFLRGTARPERLTAVVRAVAQALLETRASSTSAAAAIDAALSGGAALDIFERMIDAQGGRIEAFREMQPHPVSAPVLAPRAGYLAAFDMTALGNLARILNERDGSAAGLRIDVALGDHVKAGSTVGAVYGPAVPAEDVAAVFRWSQAPPDVPALVREIIKAGPALPA